MADTLRKYISLERLAQYDEKQKARMTEADAKVLEEAKSHAESLADNYDPAGTAQTKVEELASGQVADNAAAIVAINDEETGILKQAKDYTDAEIAKVQGEVDALEEYVGVIPETSEAKDIVAWVQEKTSGIATDSALEELTGRVAQAETDIENLEKDVEAVGAKVTTLVGEDADKSVRTIANEELAKQLIAENAQESLDTLAEIAAWIQSHPNDASAMSKAIEDLEALVGTLPEGVSATTIVAYIQEVVAAEKSRAEGVESGLDTRLQAVEAQLGTGEGSVDEKIATAKQGAIDESKEYADGLNTAMDTRVEALEAIDHDHDNKDVIDGITSEKVAAWDNAEENANEYTDGKIADEVIARDEAIATAKTESATDAQTKADKALEDAKAYTDEEIAKIDLSGVATNAEAIAALTETHTTDKAALETSITTLETGAVATNTANIATLREDLDALQEATAEEIEAIFTK